jgi:hypothetical protein
MFGCSTRRPFIAALATMACIVPSSYTLAELPVARLYSVFPSGARQGSTIDVTITGDDLEKVSQLQFSIPGINAVQKTQPPALGQEGPQPVANQFTLTLAADAPLGICEVRASGKYGISNPRSFVIGSQEELVETEPNNSPPEATAVTLGTVVNGRSDGASDQDYYKITAKAGQRILADCWAYRIDSRMDPSLVVYDASGKELGRSRDVERRDPLLDFTAPADGEYFIEVHDFLYAGNSEYFYRLAIGTDPHLDFVMPPAGIPGSTGKYTLYGRNLPGGQPTDLVTADGKKLDSLVVDITLPDGDSATQLDFAAVVEPEESAVDGFTYRLPGPNGPSNGILIGYAMAPVVAEQEPNDAPEKAQSLQPNVEVAATFGQQPDRDWYTFAAKKGDVLWIEVISQRLGLPTDPALVIQQVTPGEKGDELKEIAAVDDFLDNPEGQTRRGMAIYDMKTDDAATRFVAPAEGTYRIQVQNLASYAAVDPGLQYRLVIRAEQPDFRLVAKPRLLPFNNNAQQNPPTVWSPLLRRGGTEVIDVLVFRRDGFNGPVEITASNLPPGVSAAPITVGPGQEIGELVLSAAEDAPAGNSLLTVTGKANIAGAEVTHPARYAAMVWGGALNSVTPRARLARTLAVAVTDAETAPFALNAGGAAIETVKAAKVQIPVKLTRRGEFKGVVTLTPFPLPPGVRPPSLELKPEAADGNLELALAANTPPGTYSLMLTGTSAVSYARNPEAVTEVQARKTSVDKIVGELSAAAKAAADAKAAAEGRTNEVAAALAQSKTAADEAARQLAEAQAKMKAAADAVAAAEKQAAEAAQAKAAAEKAAAEAEAKSKQATDIQAAIAKELDAAQKAAAPKDVNVAFPSTPVTIRVLDSPIALEAATTTTAQAGGKVELPLKVARLAGYTGEVPLEVTPQGDVKGIKATSAALPADKNEAPLSFEIPAETPPGKYAFSVTAAVKFNGQDFTTTTPVELTVAMP